MTTTQQEWNIKERGETCQGCSKHFDDEEPFYSRLDFGAEGYTRRDYCAVCWTDSARRAALSTWKSVYKMPPPPEPEPLQKETAESLLRKLMEGEDPAKLNTIYILAVMLERKRILAEQDVQIREDGAKVRVYEHRKTGETFIITDPGLKLTELTSVQAEVVAMLGGGANGAATGEPPPNQPPPASPES